MPNTLACPPGPVSRRADALAELPRQLENIDTSVLPEQAARAALAVAAITVADEPAAATRLREAIGGRSGPRHAALSAIPEFDVAAELESLEKDRVRLVGLQWMLDPDLVPEGLFRTGLSPYSDLSVRHDGAEGKVVVEAVLAPDADCGALSRCLARLVDPEVRRILAQAAFRKTASDRVRAELQLPFPLDELPESWIEVVQDKLWLVRSAKGHRLRRALRWADAALRAERARSDWLRTPLTRGGRLWPPRPGSGAVATGKRPGITTVPARPLGARPFRSRRPTVPPTWPRSSAASPERGPRDVTAALGPTAQAAIQGSGSRLLDHHQHPPVGA